MNNIKEIVDKILENETLEYKGFEEDISNIQDLIGVKCKDYAKDFFTDRIKEQWKESPEKIRRSNLEVFIVCEIRGITQT